MRQRWILPGTCCGTHILFKPVFSLFLTRLSSLRRKHHTSSSIVGSLVRWARQILLAARKRMWSGRPVTLSRPFSKLKKICATWKRVAVGKCQPMSTTHLTCGRPRTPAIHFADLSPGAKIIAGVLCDKGPVHFGLSGHGHPLDPWCWQRAGDVDSTAC